MACFRFGDWHCFVTAALFLFGHLLTLIKHVRFQRELDDFGVEDVKFYNDLQPMQLAGTWVSRFDNSSLENAATFITSVAWLFFAIVMIKLAWALSMGGTREMGSSITIAVLAVAGSLSELLSNLLLLGTKKAMFHIVSTFELNDWISLRGSGIEDEETEVNVLNRRSLQQDFVDAMGNPEDPLDDPDFDEDDYEPQDFGDFEDTFEDYEDFGDQDNFDFEGLAEGDGDDEYLIDGDYSNEDYNEDGLGWKSLELLNAVSSGMVSLIDSVEFLLLAAIMITLFMAVRRGASFSKVWTYLGLVMAGISILQFILAVSSMDAFTITNDIATGLLAINQVILLPIWLVWLGVQMKDMKDFGIESTAPTTKDIADDAGFPASFN